MYYRAEVVIVSVLEPKCRLSNMLEGLDVTNAEIKTVTLNIKIYCKSKYLSNNMVYDYTEIRKKLVSMLDYNWLDDVLDCPSTYECLAEYVWSLVVPCYRVEITTSQKEYVAYEEDKE